MWFKQGQIEVECGVGCDYDGDGCEDKGRDGHAKGTSPAGILPNSPHPINNTPNNQSKPIVPLPLFLSYNFSLYSYNFQL